MHRIVLSGAYSLPKQRNPASTAGFFVMAIATAHETAVVMRMTTDIDLRKYSVMAPQIAHPNPTCQKCDTGMILNGITPCAEGYDLWSYRCLICGNTFKMIETRRKKRPEGAY